MRVAVITVSDTRTPGKDASGDRLVELLVASDATIAERRLVTDDLGELSNTLSSLADREVIDIIFTTGGTGFGPRDNTPEATRAVIEREAPGLAEAMRRETASKTPMAILSRAVCGIRGRTLIINLPGSPNAVEECFEIIRPVLGHAIDLLRGKTEH